MSGASNWDDSRDGESIVTRYQSVLSTNVGSTTTALRIRQIERRHNSITSRRTVAKSSLNCLASFSSSPPYKPDMQASPPTKAQANDIGTESTEPLSAGGCHQLLVTQDPPCLRSLTCGRYTGPDTRALPVRPDSHLLGHAGSDSGGMNPVMMHDTSSLTTHGAGPSLGSIHCLLSGAWPHFTSGEAHVVPVPELDEARALSLKDDISGMHDILLLILARPPMIRLLRSERWLVNSEAVVVRWVRSMLLRAGSDRRMEGTAGRGGGFPACVQQEKDIGFENPLLDLDLFENHPVSIDHDHSDEDIGAVHKLSPYSHDLLLPPLSKRLTVPERVEIDFQTGRLIRRLSRLPAPTGRFGSAISVLCTLNTDRGRPDKNAKALMESCSWTTAFHVMFEGILRDAEDMAVTIPYQTIRRQFRRLRHYLDAITTSRLVILDAAHDWNVVVEMIGTGHEAETGPSLASSDPQTPEPLKDWNSKTSLRVTGLRDWSNCIFGDPLMALIFGEKPSSEFLRGFSGRSRRSTGQCSEDDDKDFDPLCIYGDLVESPEEAHVRLLLYRCYHATVAVVKEFYRPRPDSAVRELAARKSLNAVLARLQGVADDPKKGHTRPSGETSLSKRPKMERNGDEKVSVAA